MDVAAGCDIPQSAQHGRRFFVDPIRGARENDGSEQRPWRTLAEVLDPESRLIATQAYTRTSSGLGPRAPINPAGPIKPGDTIVLMSGDHGDVKASQYVNDEFISVVAGNDQTPVVRSLHLVASSHWLFRGVKFQAVRPEAAKSRGLVWLESHSWQGPSDNIVLVDNSFSTEDSTADWSPQDWVNKPYPTGFFTTARCTSLVDNHFFNLRDAVSIGGDQSLIQGNLIENMDNDGIDIVASDLVVRRNRIQSGRHTPAEPLHADGIQGWTVHGETNRNVIIDSNSIINFNPADDNDLQGISIFDGRWDGLTVSNNLVINNAWHGLTILGADNAIVVNNTVIPARPQKYPSWLEIADAKDKKPSSHVVVRNNIASQLLINSVDVVFDHNIAQSKIVYRRGDGKVQASSGVVGDRNVINPNIFSEFVDYDPKRDKLDLRPGPRSAAAAAGSQTGAPASDIDGRPWKLPIDIGAYAR
jgi:hypothetical protein